MNKLVIKIVDRDTNYTNQKNGEIHPSLTGHMWFELHDSNGNVTSYGFGPIKEGSPWGPGEVKHDDNLAYEFNESKGDYKASFEINQDQFNKLKEFGASPFDKEKFNFSSTYIGTNNSCIDFTWQALQIAGFNPNKFQGDLIPTWNIDNLKKLSLEGVSANLQKKTPESLGLTDQQYLSFIESYYSLKTFDLNSFNTFLSKYNLNTNISDYSDLVLNFNSKEIFGEAFGEKLNYSAFLDLKNASQEQQDQWLNQFFETSFFDLKNNVNQIAYA